MEALQCTHNFPFFDACKQSSAEWPKHKHYWNILWSHQSVMGTSLPTISVNRSCLSLKWYLHSNSLMSTIRTPAWKMKRFLMNYLCVIQQHLQHLYTKQSRCLNLKCTSVLIHQLPCRVIYSLPYSLDSERYVSTCIILSKWVVPLISIGDL